jgi:23S rRNA (cytidine1920-2'-O)/16S rRNA (cytidine1409-2'-O)-methyltransferase
VSRRRLDEELVARGLYPSRARARDAVLRGTVSVEGTLAAKPSQSVASNAVIAIADPAKNYVSRAALKLIHALDHFKLDVVRKAALDIGASTGGFTQVLLERGASHVTAIDVGHGQLAEVLRNDPRVTLIEGLNARDLNAEHLSGPVDVIVCDVSFISLTLALPPALNLDASILVALIKPQFEAGKNASIENYDPSEIADFIAKSGWNVVGIVPSPIAGGDGNKESLLVAAK